MTPKTPGSSNYSRKFYPGPVDISPLMPDIRYGEALVVPVVIVTIILIVITTVVGGFVGD